MYFYRQLSGGNYFISVEQVVCSLQLQRLKLFTRLDVNATTINHLDGICCSAGLKDEELELIDDAITSCTPLDANVEAALYYSCGYVAKKQNICRKENIPLEQTGPSEFTDLVSRGKLTHPNTELYTFSRMCYKLFISLTSLTNLKCANQIVNMFTLLSSSLLFVVAADVKCVEAISRRLCNIFLKGYSSTECLNPPTNKSACSERSIRKLNSQ